MGTTSYHRHIVVILQDQSNLSHLLIEILCPHLTDRVISILRNPHPSSEHKFATTSGWIRSDHHDTTTARILLPQQYLLTLRSYHFCSTTEIQENNSHAFSLTVLYHPQHLPRTSPKKSFRKILHHIEEIQRTHILLSYRDFSIHPSYSLILKLKHKLQLPATSSKAYNTNHPPSPKESV